MLITARDTAKTVKDVKAVKAAVTDYEALFGGHFYSNNTIERYAKEVQETDDAMLAKEKEDLVAYLLTLRDLKCSSCRMQGHETNACWLNW